MPLLRHPAVPAATIALGLVALAGCGSSDSDSSSSTASSGATSATSGAVAAAQKVVATSASAKTVWHGPTSAPAPQAGKTIALTGPSSTQATESTGRIERALKAAAAKLGWKVRLIFADDPNDAIAQAVQLKVDGITTLGEAAQLKGGLDKAAAAHIPVILDFIGRIPANVDAPGVARVVDQRYPEEGRYGAASIVALTGGKAKIGVFTTSPGAVSSVDQTLAGTKAFLARNGGGKIVATTNWDIGLLGNPAALGQQAVAFLQAHPDVDTLWVPFAAPAESVTQPIAQAGLKVKIFTYEGSSRNLDSIRKGQVVAADVAQPLE